jgi:hypothetical protein
MKLGILTLPFHTNYGGIIQAYALQLTLNRMGHETTVINLNRYYIPKLKLIFAILKRTIKKYIFQKDVDVFYEKNKRNEFDIIGKEISKFVHDYIGLEHINALETVADKYDVIVVGSDQIWRPRYVGKNLENVFLKFTKKWDIKRIAYAASFGTDVWEYNNRQTIKCRDLIQKFDNVSVREDSGVALCKKHFGVLAEHVLDPTLLLNITDYEKIIFDTKTPKSEGNLFVYILDKYVGNDAFIELAANDLDLRPFFVSTDRTNVPIEKRMSVTMGTWLRSFYDAEFVIADSFHAVVFSIIFNKPFIVYGNEYGLTRIRSLLKLFALETRIILGFDYSKAKAIIAEPINWDQVNTNLSLLKSNSLQFLSKSLK